MNASSRWSIPNVKKYCRQIGVLCSALSLVLTNVFYFKGGDLFLGTTLFKYGLLKKIMQFLIRFSFLFVLGNKCRLTKNKLGRQTFGAQRGNRSHFWPVLGPVIAESL